MFLIQLYLRQLSTSGLKVFWGILTHFSLRARSAEGTGMQVARAVAHLYWKLCSGAEETIKVTKMVISSNTDLSFFYISNFQVVYQIGLCSVVSLLEWQLTPVRHKAVYVTIISITPTRIRETKLGSATAVRRKPINCTHSLNSFSSHFCLAAETYFSKSLPSV